MLVPEVLREPEGEESLTFGIYFLRDRVTARHPGT